MILRSKSFQLTRACTFSVDKFVQITIESWVPVPHEYILLLNSLTCSHSHISIVYIYRWLTTSLTLLRGGLQSSWYKTGLPVNSQGWKGRGWCPRGPALVRWWATQEVTGETPEVTWAWRATSLVAPSGSPSAPLPSPSPQPDTFESGRTGNGFYAACPLGTPSQPGIHILSPSALSSWRTLHKDAVNKS